MYRSYYPYMESQSANCNEDECFHDCQSTIENNNLTDNDNSFEFTNPIASSSTETFKETNTVQPEEPVKSIWFIDDDFLKTLEETLTIEELEQRHQDALDLKNTGNESFRLNNYEPAAECYTEALRKCPLMFSEDKAILFCNRAACFNKMDKPDLARDDCTKAIELNPNYEKAYLRRAQLYEESEETMDKALEDYQQITKLNPSNRMAFAKSVILSQKITDRNEKMKNEMIGKLKELGNVFLKPFGLSTENFKMEQQPGGGYSVKIEK